MEYADNTIFFELLYQDIKTNNLNILQNETIKSKLLDTAVFWLVCLKNKLKNNLSETEL